VKTKKMWRPSGVPHLILKLGRGGLISDVVGGGGWERGKKAYGASEPTLLEHGLNGLWVRPVVWRRNHGSSDNTAFRARKAVPRDHQGVSK